jgi:hypothetical protein
VSAILTFLDTVPQVLALDEATIRAVQRAPDGLATAVAILLLACISDVAGNSPLLFIRRMRPLRLVVSLVVQTLLAAVRLGIWMLSFWAIVSLLERDAVALSRVTLVIGMGYAPMLLSALVVIPALGPLIGRALEAWTLVAVTASIAVARDLAPWEALHAGLVALLAVLLVRRTSDRVVVGLLGRLSVRLLGVDVLQRTREIDPRSIATAPPAPRRSVTA